MGKWKGFRILGPSRVERQSQRNPTRPGCDALGWDACLAALHNTLATFYDAPQDHSINLTRGKVRWTATEIRIRQEKSSRGRIQTPESTEMTQADTCFLERAFAVLTRLCQEEKEKRARTKAHLKARGQSMVCSTIGLISCLRLQ